MRSAAGSPPTDANCQPNYQPNYQPNFAAEFRTNRSRAARKRAAAVGVCADAPTPTDWTGGSGDRHRSPQGHSPRFTPHVRAARKPARDVGGYPVASAFRRTNGPVGFRTHAGRWTQALADPTNSETSTPISADRSNIKVNQGENSWPGTDRVSNLRASPVDQTGGEGG
jgi:hypothetical protein